MLAHSEGLLFELEEVAPADSDGGHLPPRSVCSRIRLLSRVQGRYQQQVHQDVIYYRSELLAEEGSVDIVYLASKLASIGHDVVVRSAVGGGTNCFRNLYHEFLYMRDSDDPDAAELVVECNFREHFHIPCATPRYAAVLESIPAVFVGPLSSLAPLVQAVADEMNVAFESQGITKPPWRNARSLMSKWAPQVSKDWLPSSSPRSSPLSLERNCELGTLRALSCGSSPGVHYFRGPSEGTATVLRPVGLPQGPGSRRVSNEGTPPTATSCHSVHIGFAQAKPLMLPFECTKPSGTVGSS